MWENFCSQLEQAREAGQIETVVLEFLKTQIPEGTTLDYKWQVDLTTSKGKNDIAKWVSGIANTKGGILCLGVRDNGDGQPDISVGLHPVTIPVGVDITQQLTNILNGAINPRPLYEIYPIPVSENGFAAIIYIPLSQNRPHVVEHAGEFAVYIRRGTSFVTANREELDALYADRLQTRARIEQLAWQQYSRHLPANLESSPNMFLLLCPIGTSPEMITLSSFQGQAYQRRKQGTCNWYNLPDTPYWKGCSEAALYDASKHSSPNTANYRALAFRDGRLAVWSILNPHEEYPDQIYPDVFFGTLYGALLPWVSFLSNLGLCCVIQGIVLCNNFDGKWPFLPSNFIPQGADSFRFDLGKFPLPPFSLTTTDPAEQIINYSFGLLSQMMYAAGHTRDFSEGDDPYYSFILRKTGISS